MVDTLATILPVLAASGSAFAQSFICVFYSCCCLFSLLFFVFWIWMLIEVITKEPAEEKDRVMWILIVALTHWIGAAIYYFVRRPKRIQQYGR